MKYSECCGAHIEIIGKTTKYESCYICGKSKRIVTNEEATKRNKRLLKPYLTYK